MVKKKAKSKKKLTKLKTNKIRKNPEDKYLYEDDILYNIKKFLEEDGLKIKKIKLYNDFWQIKSPGKRSHVLVYMVRVKDMYNEKECILMIYHYDKLDNDYWSGRLNNEEKEFAEKYNFI